MSFRITGLSPEPFLPLYGLSDAALRDRGVVRRAVDISPGYPERIELRDAAVGENLLLLNHTYQPADSPYHGRHAIFIREGAREAASFTDDVPDVMRRRTLSIRAFNADHFIIMADLVAGAEADTAIERLLALPGAAYLHAHYAKYGCFAARIDPV
ncbi:hypothetical protein VZ95_08390 [Elstera litoralis]|uniref:DUF1203 domain-containing protein n=1 Tax=Elstera litoralis TaxID=552518 RepID=A0A0F3ITM5_9PROT|nr:DUF1203 domain-containing protein [Elstera litoralis]KJV09913.1 hypothetical protein VZ95_08390 [Elstera litoralis]